MRAAFQWAFLVLILTALAAAFVRACDIEAVNDEARIKQHIAANRAAQK
jgi:hypothetical protein